jgi:hypothetical protein
MSIYIKDNLNNDMLYREEDNFQVMMEWEKPYMEEMVKRLNPRGHVLEIGFGLGYSATEIQKYEIKSHTIIEDDPEVLVKLKSWKRKQKKQVNIVEGTWQENIEKLNKFDSIFFDDAPHLNFPDPTSIRVYDFYYKILENHVNKNARMVWFSDRPIYWFCHPQVHWKGDFFNIEIPESCEYVQKESKKNKKMYIPMLEFPYGSVSKIEKIFFDKDGNFGKFNL